MRSVCVLMTCFNRREATLKALQAIACRVGCQDLRVQVLIVDDASTDGTVAAVSAAFPDAQVEESEGELYWCRGMHRAFGLALKEGYDHYLWLNDDTVLDADALSRLVQCAEGLERREGGPVIVAGTTRDPCAARFTYGGWRINSRVNRLAMTLVEPRDEPQAIDTFNGNVVLITARAAHAVGNLDPKFEHAMGDIDYGLRAWRRRVSCWVAPGTLGTCSNNPTEKTYLDSSLPWRLRLTLMLDRKGLPWRSWLLLTRRHAGWIWPLLFGWPYFRLLVSAVRRPAT